MRRFFAQGRRSEGPAPAYEVVCSCGHAVRGVRDARRQVAKCPVCGRAVFVLPRSPLPAPETPLTPGLSPRHGPVTGSAAWRLPLAGAAATLVLLLVLFVALLPFLGRRAPVPKETDNVQDIAALTAEGRRALADGDFHLALRKLSAARDQDRRRPNALSATERQDLIQLERQSDLLSRLSSRSLQDIVQEADLVRHDDEWKARFDRDYQGKTILFDDVVRFEDVADDRRRPVLMYYRVVVGDREVRLALEDLTLLQSLAREKPQRVLFGGRLAAVERGPGGRWAVRFDPDSGVLLTDRGAAEAVCPLPLDPELIDVLKRQAEWLQRNATDH